MRGEGDQCQPAGAGGSGGQGGSGGPSGAGGMAPAGAPVLQMPPRRVGLRRARAIDVTIGLQQPVDVDLSVTVDGLPAYMAAEPLTLPAGATSGVLVMRATNEAPLGVPSQVRVRAAGGTQPAEAVLEAWVQGEPGTLDETFGEGGVVDEGAPTYNVVGAVPKADGSFLVVGSDAVRKRVAIAHYTAEGKLDDSFGDPLAVPTLVLYSPPPSSPGVYADEEEPRAVATQADGNFIVFGIRRQLEKGPAAGQTQVKGHQWHVSRHLPDGTLDPGFGQGGAVSLSDNVVAPAEAGPLDYYTVPIGGVALGSDGAIVVAARDSYAAGSPHRLVRLTPDGVLDSGFGQGGFVRGAALPCAPRTVTVAQDGGISVLGSAVDDQNREQVCVARFLANGAPDTAFGAGGVRALPVLQEGGILYERGFDVSAQQDGAVVVSGFSRFDTSDDRVLLAKLAPGGSYEASFGKAGRSSEAPPSKSTGDSARITSMMTPRQSAGIVAAVQSFTDATFGSATPLTLSVTRYDSQGRIDHDFGADGDAIIPIDGSEQGAYLFETPHLIEASDGRLVLVGFQQGKQRLARLWP